MGCMGKKAVIKNQAEIQLLEKTRYVFVVGGPGSGKRTQCKRIAEEFGFRLLTIPEIIHYVIKLRVIQGWDLINKEYVEEKKEIESLKLVTFIQLVVKKLDEDKVLLEGFPRNKNDVQEWFRQTNDNLVELYTVLYFDLPVEQMKIRQLATQEDHVTEEEAKKRIAQFQRETKPTFIDFEVLDKFIRVDAMLPVEDVFKAIKEEFILKKFYR
jgi:UMP-CMP kinase